MHTLTSIFAISAAAVLLTNPVQAQTPPGVDTSTYILENLNGTAAHISSNDVHAGVPVTTIYNQEGNFAHSVALGNAGLTSNTFTGTYATGDVVLTSTGTLATSQGQCTSASPCTFAAPGATDPLNSYQFVQATNANVAAQTGQSPVTVAPATPANFTNTWVSGDYAANATTGALQSASSCSTAGSCTWVSPSAVESARVAIANLPGYISANVGHAGFASATGDSTTTYRGGAVYSGSGGTTAIGTGGINTTGSNGNTTTLTAGKMVLGYQGVPGVGITLDSTVDPVLTVSGGTPATTTTINNGAVTAGSSLSVGTGTHTTTISNGNVNTTGTVTANTISDGAGTTVSGGQVTTNTVSANAGGFGILATEDSHGTVYGNVGNTLTTYGADISTLYGLYGSQQAQINSVRNLANKALQSAAIVAAFPELHFGPGDWLAVGAGGADAGGQGAWGLAAGALVSPHIMLQVKGGGANNTYTVAGGGSISFGGGYQPLK